jgi:TatA/E family protein of Tat protein translocase
LAGLTPAHLFIVLIIALVVIGPGKLPEVGSAVGKSIREFQKASSGVQESVTGALGQPAPQATGQQTQPVAQLPVAQPQVWSQPVVYAQPGYEAGYMPQAYPAPVYQAPVAPQAHSIEAAPALAMANEMQPRPRAD